MIKYLGMVFEAKWKCVSRNGSSMYVFENVYNHSTIQMSHRQIGEVIRGETTIGAIMSRRISKDKTRIGAYRNGNGVQRRYARQRQRHMNGD